MFRNFSFPLLHCYSAMDVLQMQMKHCNKYQNNQNLSLLSGSDILPIYLSCPANTIYDLPINLRYIHKRVPALVISLWIMPMKEKATKYKRRAATRSADFSAFNICKKYRSEGNTSFVICSLLWQFLRTDIVFNRP